MGFLSPGGELVLVEIKLVSSLKFVEAALKRRQIQRLRRSAEFLGAILRLPVHLKFAAVTSQGETLLIESGVFD